MSVHVWSWVLNHSPAGDRDVGSSPLDRLVLLVLADHAHKNGSGAHPDEDLIARESRGKKRSVYYALDALEKAGCIEQTGVTEHGVRIWRVLMTEQAKRAKFAGRPTRKPRHGAAQTLHESSANGDGPSANGDAVNARASINRQEPSIGTAHGTALARASAREGNGHGGGGEDPPRIVVPAGATAKTRSRLQRTAERTGAQLVHERSPGGRST